MIETDSTTTEEAAGYHLGDVAYWLTKTASERMAELERLRREAYFAEQAKLGNYPTELPQMQKVVRIIKLKDK